MVPTKTYNLLDKQKLKIQQEVNCFNDRKSYPFTKPVCFKTFLTDF